MIREKNLFECESERAREKIYYIIAMNKNFKWILSEIIFLYAERVFFFIEL